MMKRTAVLVGLVAVGFVFAPRAEVQEKVNLPEYVRKNYTRQDVQIPMRDGVKLYTVIYSPKDAAQKYPIMMTRTPYSVGPYGKESMRSSLGPNRHFTTEGYIFVYQDVRGCYMSEGKFVNMRPHSPRHKDKNDIDESTDTYDTIDWLVKNVENNNGKVGLSGISYPGFYSSAGMIDAHPALKAVSPQAPIADWFFDDFYHHGAFFLTHFYNFFSSFGLERAGPTTSRPFGGKIYDTNDGYQFWLNMGSLANVDPKQFKGKVAYWNEIVEHPSYDEYWQARNILPHLKNVAPAVMTVGGWFDAEDLYGALQTYRAVEKQNKNFNILVMGPWAHGGWAGLPGDRLGNISFGGAPSDHYQQHIELPFFNHFLKGKGEHQLPEATVFETGVNQWRKFETWPPKESSVHTFYLHNDGRLMLDKPAAGKDTWTQFLSDPARPVPFTEAVTTGMTREYMTDDQRFASKRPDVVVFQTHVLEHDLTLSGPIVAHLKVSTSATDADWVVKLIDVFPQDASGVTAGPLVKPMAGYEMMVRSEAIRGRYREGYAKPKPFVANEPTMVHLPLQDVMHTFKKGHRMMVQICSTWFPLMDRNPQNYVDNIFKAKNSDFTSAWHRVFCDGDAGSNLTVHAIGQR